MISAASHGARAPTQKAAAGLVAWRPPHGVVSLYCDADPAERTGRWRIELRDDLDRIAAGVAKADRERRFAVEATVRRIEDGLAAERSEPESRGVIGFIEASRKRGEERWFATHLPPWRTEARYGRGPHLGPLLALLDDGAPVGVAAVSGERVRLFQRRLGGFERLQAWELELFSLDWRERKAPVSRDPASSQTVSAAGHDQYDQRLESNRERFAHETGKLARADAGRLGWRQLLVFGDERYARPFEAGFAGRCELRHVDSSDLVSESTHAVAERIERLMPALNRERERALIERVQEATFKEARAALGPQETLQSLEEGRVEHLIYDAEHGDSELERMIGLALSSGAAITPVEQESARLLSEQDGVAALLRY